MTNRIEQTPRPKEVTIGATVLAGLYVYGLYGAIAGGQLTPDWSTVFARGYVTLAVTPLLILGIWFGVGAARTVSVVLFIGRQVSYAVYLNLIPTTSSVTGLLFMAAHAAGLILLFLPASNAWFRSRKQKLKRHRLYPFGLAIGIVFGIPLVMALLMSQMAPVMGSLGMMLFMGIVHLFDIPAIIFGRSHFMFGVGPADATGWVLAIAFYALVAAALGAGLRFMRRKEAPAASGIDARAATRMSWWSGVTIAAIALGLLAVMIMPLVRGSPS